MVGSLALDTHVVGTGVFRDPRSKCVWCDERPAARLASLSRRSLHHGERGNRASVEERASVGGSASIGGRASLGERTSVGKRAPFPDMVGFSHTPS